MGGGPVGPETRLRSAVHSGGEGVGLERGLERYACAETEGDTLDGGGRVVCGLEVREAARPCVVRREEGNLVGGWEDRPEGEVVSPPLPSASLPSLIPVRRRGGCRAVTATLQDPMAVPPAYCDLGKAARDVFNKGYGFGMVKLDLKTKSSSGVEFTTTGTSNTDTGKATGSLETKYKFKDYGLTFTQKWNTDNNLGTEMTMEDKLAEGLKVDFETIFVPNTGKKSGKLKTAYKREYINLGCNVDIDLSGPTIHGWGVLGYDGWLAGYQMAFDTAKSKLSQSNFALGYKAADFQLHTNVNDGTEFGGSVYQKVSDKVETSVSLAWTAGSNNTRFGIATKYQLDDKASVSAKVSNASLIGLGYTQTLRPGVKLTLSGLIDGKNFSSGGHKIGLGFELEA